MNIDLNFIRKNLVLKSNAWVFRDSLDFFLTSKLMEEQESTRWHSHECVEFVCIYSGSGLHRTPKSEIVLSAGDVFVVPPGLKHCYVVRENEKLMLCNLFFVPKLLPFPQFDLCRVAGFEQLFLCQNVENTPNGYPFLHLNSEQLTEIRRLLDELSLENSDGNPGSRTCRMALFMLILCKLTRIYSHSMKKTKNVDDGIRRVIEYLNMHFREKIDVAKLPAMSHMSRSSFLRAFLLAAGMAPLQYVLRLRINQACRELIETEQTISETAYSCGFSDSSYFSRMFHHMLGISPKEFRLSSRVSREHDRECY